MYLKFGRSRNAIQHFTSPDRDVAGEAIEFIYGVVDPFIHQCWGLFAIDFNEDYEPHIYLVQGLLRRGIKFLVSPDMLKSIDDTSFEWPEGNSAYKKEMEKRIKKAKKLLSQD